MKPIDWGSINMTNFWKISNDLRDQTLKHAAGLFSYVETADYESLTSLLIQYRFFIIYYISDLAILISRMKDGRLRSFLAEVLDDELGGGDAQKSHPKLYDDFLESLELDRRQLDAFALKENIELLEDNRKNLVRKEKSSAYGIGLRGMGSECICQIYLEQLYEHLNKNPYVQANKNKIDWAFWDLHVDEHGIKHHEQARALIHSEIFAHGSEALVDLGKGYEESMTTWQQFWDNILASVRSSDMQHIPVIHEPDFATLSQGRDADNSIRQFHLAVPVRDLEHAKNFYCNILGAREGRSTDNHIDLNLYGHHFVIHIAPQERDDLFSTFPSDFHGETVPVPHFGLNLDRSSWLELAQRITSKKYEFYDPPHIRLEGHPGEHASMFLIDPSGNALEFKSFRNHDEVFEKVFDPKTKELFALEEMVKIAVGVSA